MNEKDVLELNNLEDKKDFTQLDLKLRTLSDKGVSVINVWNDVEDFRTLNGFKKRIIKKIEPIILDEALLKAENILTTRQLKKSAVKEQDYAKAKDFSDSEWKQQLQLYLFIRQGSKKTFCKLNDKTLDILQPFPDGML